MKVSEQFKSTIKAYLDNMAAVDSLFAPVYQKPTKNIDNCITYILNQGKHSINSPFHSKNVMLLL